MEPHLFEEVADIVTGMAPQGLGELRMRFHRRGIKVWFGPSKPPKLHYEAQIVGRRYVDDIDGMAIEIGFHAELPDEQANQDAINVLTAAKSAWKKELGSVAEADGFLGNIKWRRFSEVWIEPELEEPDFAFEIGSRLVDYLELLEPIRQG